MEAVKTASPMSVPPPEEHEDPKKKKPKSLILKVIAITSGSALILFGIAGLFLPILQGWLMIIAGLAVLSPYSRRARRIMNFLKEKLRIRKKDEGAK